MARHRMCSSFTFIIAIVTKMADEIGLKEKIAILGQI